MSHQQTHAGRTVLITGSTSGIGLGIAKVFAATGANVVMNGLGKPEAIAAARREVSDIATAQVHFDPADMREPDQIRKMVLDAVHKFSGIDILVNNAGIQHVAPVQDFPIEKWNDIIAINLSSAFHTISAAVPGMLDKGWGRIVNIASAHALRASPYKSAYIAAKHGIAGLTKTIALELARNNITVNAIAPGYVDTPLVRGQIADTAKARGITEKEVIEDVMLSRQPTKRLVTIEQVADLALYLCSEHAASITGSVLPLDGGWTAR